MRTFVPDAGRARAAVPTATRPVRFFEVTRSGGDVEPWLVLGEPSTPARRRGRLSRMTYLDVGFASLDPGTLLFPVAPRWRLAVDEHRLRLVLDGDAFVDVDLELVPPDWRDALDAEGMAWVAAGLGVNLAADRPLDALGPAMQLGLVYGGLVLA